MDDTGRVRSNKISVVLLIQQFDFEYNLVMTRKSIIESPPASRLKPLYNSCTHAHTAPCIHDLSKFREVAVRNMIVPAGGMQQPTHGLSSPQWSEGKFSLHGPQIDEI